MNSFRPSLGPGRIQGEAHTVNYRATGDVASDIEGDDSAAGQATVGFSGEYVLACAVAEQTVGVLVQGIVVARFYDDG